MDVKGTGLGIYGAVGMKNQSVTLFFSQSVTFSYEIFVNMKYG